MLAVHPPHLHTSTPSVRSQVRSVNVDLIENQQSKDVGTFKEEEGRKREEGSGDAGGDMMGDLQKVWPPCE